MASLLNSLDNIKFWRRNPSEECFHPHSIKNGYHRQIGSFPKKSPYNQRVTVKAAYAPPSKLKKHLFYLTRDSAGSEGKKPEFFTQKHEVQKIEEILGYMPGEKRIFKFIISPENGDKIESLENYTQKIMKKAERCLREKLHWAAVVHKNTENHHIHIIVRGLTKDKKNLIIDSRFMRYGFREICQLEATNELGYRLKKDILKARIKEIDAERFTSIDRRMIALREKDGVIVPINEPEKKRLQFLSTLNLATHVVFNRWRLKESFSEELRKMGRHGDIIKEVYGRKGIETKGRLVIHQPGIDIMGGKIIKTGSIDELRNKPYVVMEKGGKHIFIDGRVGMRLKKEFENKRIFQREEIVSS